MPPSSRKRTKGKERKAKKEAKLEVEKMNAQKVLQTVWRVWAQGSIGLCGKLCNHGFDSMVINHVERPVSSFIEACWSEDFELPVVMRSYLAHREVWDNDSYRTMTIDILTMIGTNLLLNEEAGISWPLNIAHNWPRTLRQWY